MKILINFLHTLWELFTVVIPGMSLSAPWHVSGILLALLLMAWIPADYGKAPGKKKVFYFWDRVKGTCGPFAFPEVSQMPAETLLWDARERIIEALSLRRFTHGILFNVVMNNYV